MRLTIVQGITALLHNCPRLTHLSLTGVQAFLREDLTRFCRDAPAEFTHPQRDVFCVFSGDGVQRLRDYLMRMAIEQADREGRDPIDDSLLDGVESPGVDTMSDDGTIDGNEHGMDMNLPPRHISPFVTNPRLRVRPRSLHELPSYHVEMPLFRDEQVQRYGVWTPNETPGPSGPASQPVLGTQPIDVPFASYSRRSRSPAIAGPPAVTPGYEQDGVDPARTPSRRHTLIESTAGYFGQQPPTQPIFPAQPHAAFERFAELARSQLRQQPQPSQFGPAPPAPPQHGSHLYDLGMRSAQDIRQTYLRPDHDFSAFDANHEAIMSTIPGSRSASRHPSRSNSPHASRVSSRSRLSNLLSSMRTNPFTNSEGRGPFGSRSLSRSRREEEEHRQRMLHALAEADAAQQLRPDLLRGTSSRTIELPLLAPEQVESIAPATASARGEASGPSSSPRNGSGSGGVQAAAEPEDVTMTQ